MLQYFIPGYWSIYLFNFFDTKKTDSVITMIMSCVLSYIYLSAIAFARVKIPAMVFFPDIAIVNSFVAIILATALSVITVLVFHSEWFSKLTIHFFQKAPSGDIWRSVLDLKNGSNLKIYLRESNYYVIGHHKAQEENGDNSWLAVSGFAKFDKSTNLPLEGEPSYLNDSGVIYTIRLSDIEHIEVF